MTLHTDVSEKVMGWSSGTDGSIGKYWWVDPGRKGICDGHPYCQRKTPCSNWNPTKDANHALEVLERLRAKGYEFRLGPTDSGWEVMIVDPEMDDTYTHATTLPLAICRAAVKAVI